MGRPQWKTAEMKLAKFFGTTRRPLSGGNQSGNVEGPRDDGQHDVLHLENKYGVKVAPWSLFKETEAKAKKEGRVPVLGLQQKGEGMLVCFRDQDAEAVVQAWAEAHGYKLLPKEDTDAEEPKTERSSKRKRNRKKARRKVE